MRNECVSNAQLWKPSFRSFTGLKPDKFVSFDTKRSKENLVVMTFILFVFFSVVTNAYLLHKFLVNFFFISSEEKLAVSKLILV
jgi:hypothetical protein